MRTLLEEITEYKQLHDKLSSSLKADGCKYTLVNYKLCKVWRLSY
ncbi:hypothetical protein [Methanosphaera sp. BMS]|nr:hypothetical protein [Methanosphaera sp. BMS]